ncbi:threonine/serine exporter family protein [Kribbella sp. NPDC003557]|uniref:threonine/serine exporter family protein n=1 Tax=Kribbella sp. NPDC003557 TaxID=3154449 RepID=UPI0033B2F557
MTERRGEVYEALDLALRIGEVLLLSGAGAADVTAAMLAVTDACGVHNVSADVTFVDLTLRHQPAIDVPAALQVRRVTWRPVDYAELIEVDETVNSLVAGDITRREARDQVARIVSTGRSTSRRRAASWPRSSRSSPRPRSSRWIRRESSPRGSSCCWRESASWAPPRTP